MGSPHESLKVDENLEREFEKALEHQLTDEDIERARLLLGVDVVSKHQELYTVASPDAIRNWAMGVGDDNPLYVDDDYGKGTRWGSQIAHGTMAGHIKTPMLGDPMPNEIKERTKGVFRGVHVFVSGGTWDWYRPIFAGDRIYSFAGEESLEVKRSEFADRSVMLAGRRFGGPHQPDDPLRRSRNGGWPSRGPARCSTRALTSRSCGERCRTPPPTLVRPR